MSAFLVEDKTIHKILTQVGSEIQKSYWFKDKFVKEMSLDFGNPDWQTHLGQNMCDLNQLSLWYRYGDKKIALTYRFQPVPCTPVQAFKSLQCWLYQCTEGEIPYTAKLYRFFNMVVAAQWAESIVKRTPEYDQAEWG